MNTLARSSSLDTRFLHLYRPLVRKLLLLLAVAVLSASSAVFYFDHRLVGAMSATILDNASRATGEKVERLFKQVSDSLMLAQMQMADIDPGDPDQVPNAFKAMLPFIDTYAPLDSINFADTEGNEIVAIRQDGDRYQTRTLNATEPGVARWQIRESGRILEQWQRHTDVSPLQRQWFQGAIAHGVGDSYWTEPYRFLTTGVPGISVSTRWPAEDGAEQRVIAFNTSLLNISRYTVAQTPSENGLVVIFRDNGHTIGLPRNAGFDDDEKMLAASLTPVAELGVDEIAAAFAAWDEQGRSEGMLAYATPARQEWWASFARIHLDAEHALWSLVLVPEADLVGNVSILRNFTLAAIALLAVLTTAAILATSMRSIRSQMKGAVDQVERRLGQYQIEDKIGQGGNGSVFRASHALLRRPTALKLMSPEFAGNESARQRFEKEVRMTSSLNHPNTVAVYDFGRTSGNTLYYAMELLNGCTLDRLVRTAGPLPPERVIYILRQICGSLSEAHSRGLIHRDIKPSNVILCERGGLHDVVKVLDFGLVRNLADGDGDSGQGSVLVGTVFFMAPELIAEANSASPASDIYAVGSVAYYLLTGVNVFEGSSVVDVCDGHLNDIPVPPSRRIGKSLPADLENIVLSCLEKKPGDRPVSAEALDALLADCADAGKWSPLLARQWWANNGASLSGAPDLEEDVSLSRTDMLIDADGRMATHISVRPASPETRE